MTVTLNIGEAAAGERADRYIAEQMNVTRAAVQKWMEQAYQKYPSARGRNAACVTARPRPV